MDFSAPMQNMAQLLPDYAGDALKERQVAMQEGQVQNQRAQVMQAQQKFQVEQAQEAAYQRDLQAAFADGTPAAFANLMRMYPEKSEAGKRAFDAQEEAVRAANLKDMALIHGAIQNKNIPLAIKQLERRIAADPDDDDTTDLEILAALKRGTPDDVKFAGGMAMLGVGYADPEKFATNYGAVDTDTVVVDGLLINKRTGDIIGQDPRGNYQVSPLGLHHQAPIKNVPTFGGVAPAASPVSEVAAPTASPGAVTAPAAPTPPTGRRRGYEQDPNVNLTQLRNFASALGRVTNDKRGPGDYERLKRKGYKPAANSAHNNGRSIDIVLKPGVTHEQAIKQFEARGYVVDREDSYADGTHSHITVVQTPSKALPPKQSATKLRAAAAEAIRAGADPVQVNARLSQMLGQ